MTDLSPVYSNGVLFLVALLLLSLTLWTLIGNFLVFVALCRFRKLRTTANFLIGNLASSDFFLALTVMPLSAINDMSGQWILGEVACKLWLSFDVLYCTASIWGLLAIAFDRFTATVFPLWYRSHEATSSKRVVLYVLAVWLLSALICLPPLVGLWPPVSGDANRFFVHNSSIDNSSSQCVLYSDKLYVVYSSLGSFLIPLVLMLLLYLKIFCVLRARAKLLCSNRKKQELIFQTQLSTKSEAAELPPCAAAAGAVGEDSRRGDGDPESMHVIATSSHNDPSTADCIAESEISAKPILAAKASLVVTASQQQHRPGRFRASVTASNNSRADKRERRATKIMALIIALFVLCWVPFTAMYMTRSFCGDACPEILHLRLFVTWLGYANSGLNPILYTIFNDDFREAFKAILHCAP